MLIYNDIRITIKNLQCFFIGGTAHFLPLDLYGLPVYYNVLMCTDPVSSNKSSWAVFSYLRKQVTSPTIERGCERPCSNVSAEELPLPAHSTMNLKQQKPKFASLARFSYTCHFILSAMFRLTHHSESFFNYLKREDCRQEFLLSTWEYIFYIVK